MHDTALGGIEHQVKIFSQNNCWWMYEICFTNVQNGQIREEQRKNKITWLAKAYSTVQCTTFLGSFSSEATLQWLMSARPSVRLSVSSSDLGVKAIFSAPNWDRVLFFCAHSSHIWAFYSIDILSIGLSFRLLKGVNKANRNGNFSAAILLR